MPRSFGAGLKLSPLVTRLAKQDDNLAPHGPGLGQAQRQHVHARFPGHFSGRRTCTDQRIGQPGPVKMQGQAMTMGQRGVAMDLVCTVGKTTFRQIGQREDSRRSLVNKAWLDRCERRAQDILVNLCALPRQQGKFATTGKEFRSPPLIALDMRFLMAENGTGRRAEA